MPQAAASDGVTEALPEKRMEVRLHRARVPQKELPEQRQVGQEELLPQVGQGQPENHEQNVQNEQNEQTEQNERNEQYERNNHEEQSDGTAIAH